MLTMLSSSSATENMSDEDRHLRALLDRLAGFLHQNDPGEERPPTSERAEKPASVADETWACFDSLRQVYSLEGDQTQWLACLLYLTNEKQLTVNKRELKSTVNKFSYDFLRLMQFTKASLAAFFAKMSRAIEMINMPRELCAPLEQIERNFNVSCILFAKFRHIFGKLFELRGDQGPSGGEIKELFDITWLLFVYVKEKFPHVGSDLVNSFQLLVCCLNLVHTNLAPTTTPSVIDSLCKEYEIQSIEVKTIYEHYFKPQIRLIVGQKVFATGADWDRLDGLFPVGELAELQATKARLADAYESLLVASSAARTVSAIFELDERLFLAGQGQSGVVESRSPPADAEMADEEQRTVSRRRVHLPDCFTSLYRLAEAARLSADESSRQRLARICPVLGELNFDGAEILAPLESLIDARLTGAVREALLGKLAASGKIPAEQRDLSAVDELLEFNKCFYYALLDKLFDSERGLQTSLHGQAACEKSLELLVKNEPFHKSLFACCFEMIAKFSSVHWEPVAAQPGKSNQKATGPATQLNLAADKELEFPWILAPLELQAFDFFRIIELFVKTMTQATSLNSVKPTPISTTASFSLQLNRDMVRHLGVCEDRILESLAWQRESTLWPTLTKVRLRCEAEAAGSCLRTIAFPFYEDVQPSQPAVATVAAAPALCQPPKTAPGVSSGAASAGAGAELVLNLTPNPVSSSASMFSSPVKQPAPTITRVVCGAGQQGSAQKDQGACAASSSGPKIVIAPRNFPRSLSSKPTITATEPVEQSTKAAASRLENVSGSLGYFFRKFYALAHNRMKEIVDRIDFSSVAKLDQTRTNFDYSLASMTPVPSAGNGSILATSAQTQTRSLSAVPFSNSSIIPPSQTVNAERLGLLLRRAWAVFEYSVSCDPSEPLLSLMCDRHLDQLILCAIYITCKVTLMPVQFQEIMRMYRATWQPLGANLSHVYRSVLIDQEAKETRGDIIQFYNQVYVRKVRTFALQASNSGSVLVRTPVVDSSAALMLSPAPKMQMATSAHTQFSPRKVVENHLVFVSPSKITSSSAQSVFQRKKLTFTFKDPNPSQSLELINEMIKNNEAKIRASNKRLFSEVSSSLSNIVNGNRSFLGSVGPLSAPSLVNRNENKTKKFSPMPFTIRSATSTNLLSSIVSSGAKLPMPKSTSSSSLVPAASGASPAAAQNVTRVAPGSAVASARPIVTSVITGGSSFARKLLNIQTERSVNK